MFAELKKYLELHIEYYRLGIVEKLTVFLSSLLLIFVLILLGMITLLYLSFAAAYLLEPAVGGLAVSFALVAGGNVLLLAAVIVFRKRLIVKPVVRFLVRLFLNGSRQL